MGLAPVSAPVPAATVPASAPAVAPTPAPVEKMVEQSIKPEGEESSVAAALPTAGDEAALDKEAAPISQEKSKSPVCDTPSTSSPTPVSSANADIEGRGAQKRKGRKNSRAGLTSTTPTPQTAEEAQDEVAAKPTEPSLEKESRTEPSPAAQEVAEPVEKVEQVKQVVPVEAAKQDKEEKEVAENEVAPQMTEVKSITTADALIETVITNGDKQETTSLVVETEPETTTPAVAINEAETPSSNKSSMLRFSYKDDQWSPLNPEGKKTYDRVFLLELQNTPASQKKPLGLPNLEVVRDKNSVSKRVDFAPPYLKLAPGKSVAKRSSQQGVGGGQQPPRREIKLSSMSSMPRQERVEDPNAWKPKHASKSKEKDAKEGSETDELLKVVRGILNKITPSKYDKLLETFKELNIETEDQLSGVIKLFFERLLMSLFSRQLTPKCAEHCRRKRSLLRSTRKRRRVSVSYCSPSVRRNSKRTATVLLKLRLRNKSLKKPKRRKRKKN